jgi:hypothetical protein
MVSAPRGDVLNDFNQTLCSNAVARNFTHFAAAVRTPFLCAHPFFSSGETFVGNPAKLSL